MASLMIFRKNVVFADGSNEVKNENVNRVSAENFDRFDQANLG